MNRQRFREEIKPLLIVYFGNWLFWFLLITLRMVSRGGSFERGVEQFADLMLYSSFLIGIHIFFALFYTIFLIVRYFIRVGRRLGLRPMIRQLVLRLFLPVGLLAMTYSLLVRANASEDFNAPLGPETLNKTGIVKDLYQSDKKHRGMTLFGWRDINDTAIDRLVEHHVEWLALVPFMYQQNPDKGEVYRRDQYDSFSGGDSIFIRYIDHLHQRGVKVHLKPHLWTREGWRSDIQQPNQQSWEKWFDSYERHMLHYAQMAEASGADLFCIGTELHTAVINNPQRWTELIAKIRGIYSGPLTYAANWYEEFEDVQFWDELDFIGIQAYFPLTSKPNPDLTAIRAGWQPHLEKLKALSERHSKKILFTEIGYKSEASATVKPWEWEPALSQLTRKKSDETQHLAYQAVFEEIWDQPWFAGMYIWQWDIRTKAENAATDLDFSPRYKAASFTISKGYGD